MVRIWGLFQGIGLSVALTGVAWAGTELSSAERGKKALEERAFNPIIWSSRAYGDAWRQWKDGTQKQPSPYGQAFMDHYGLHPAPFPSLFPMGLRPVRGLLGAGITS